MATNTANNKANQYDYIDMDEFKIEFSIHQIVDSGNYEMFKVILEFKCHLGMALKLKISNW
jgi:hypothetical protein